MLICCVYMPARFSGSLVSSHARSQIVVSAPAPPWENTEEHKQHYSLAVVLGTTDKRPKDRPCGSASAGQIAPVYGQATTQGLCEQSAECVACRVPTLSGAPVCVLRRSHRGVHSWQLGRQFWVSRMSEWQPLRGLARVRAPWIGRSAVEMWTDGSTTNAL